jgi:hypothetical protein
MISGILIQQLKCLDIHANNRSTGLPVSNGTSVGERAALRTDITARGQQVPIVVVADSTGYLVLDGLKRLLVADDLGHETIDAVVTSGFAELTELMHTLHFAAKHIGWPPDTSSPRLYAMYLDLLPLRRRQGRAAPHGPSLGPLFRTGLEQAIGNERGSKTKIMSTITLYSAALNPNSKLRDYARDLIYRQANGEFAIGSALNMYQNATKGKDFFYGPITDADQQRSLLRGATNTLNGLVLGLLQLGKISPKLSKAERAELLRLLKLGRAQLQRFIRLYEEEGTS